MMYLIIDQPPLLSIMVFLFFLVSSASFGTGNPGLAEPIHRGDRGGTGNPGFAVPDFYPAGLSRADRFGTAETAFLCRACCIGVGLPVLLPRRAGFPRRSVRCGGILWDKLRETPVSHCVTIRVLFLMLVVL